MDYVESFELERQGTVTIKSDPSGANIYINGTLEEYAPTNVSVELPFGTYEITVVKDGYAPATQVIDVSTKYDSQPYYKTFEFALEEDPDYVVPDTDVTSEETIVFTESTDTESIEKESIETETSKESLGFTGIFSVILLGCAYILIRNRTQ